MASGTVERTSNGANRLGQLALRMRLALEQGRDKLNREDILARKFLDVRREVRLVVRELADLVRQRLEAANDRRAGGGRLWQSQEPQIVRAAWSL